MTGSPVVWREWDLQGLDVTQLRFDFRLVVIAWSRERSLELTLGSPFRYRSPDGEVQLLNPEQSVTLGGLLRLVHLPLRSFAASSEGCCRLSFSDGTELHGEPDPDYEAWETDGEGGLPSLLCSPGGGVPWYEGAGEAQF